MLVALVAASFALPQSVSAKKKPPKAKLQVSVLPVDVGPDSWAWVSPNDWPAHSYPPIHIFGHTYIDGKTEVALTISMLKIGTPVVASYGGVVTRIANQPESCDAEVYIDLPTGGTIHGSYDHITPSVKVGQKVVAGQVIGSVPAWQCTNSFGGMELMFVEETKAGVRALCPLAIVDPKKKAVIAGQIRKVMEDWNAYAAGARSVYTPDDLTRGVCESRYAPV